MRNLLEMFEAVEDLCYQLGIDPKDLLNYDNDEYSMKARETARSVRICGAHQPNWPLAENVSRLVLLEKDQGDEDAKEPDGNINPDDNAPWVKAQGIDFEADKIESNH